MRYVCQVKQTNHVPWDQHCPSPRLVSGTSRLLLAGSNTAATLSAAHFHCGVSTATKFKNQIFQDVTLCQWGWSDRRFEGSHCLHLQGHAVTKKLLCREFRGLHSSVWGDEVLLATGVVSLGKCCPTFWYNAAEDTTWLPKSRQSLV